MAHIDRGAKAPLDSVSSGKLLKLRDGLYKQLKDREWILKLSALRGGAFRHGVSFILYPLIPLWKAGIAGYSPVNRIENNWVFLVHKEGAYGVVVRIEHIDWREC